jgi:H+/Cl- antiporter ClcA
MMTAAMPQDPASVPIANHAAPLPPPLGSRGRALLSGIALGTCAGVLCGAASALFLFLLDRATATRVAHPALVFALPAAGLAMGWMIDRWGAGAAGGNNLVIDAIHDTGPLIPWRMAPMVLAGTVLTHLFGGSAGREGTAVQMGASLADAVARGTKLRASLRRQLLVAGVAGGFASVFGTPAAGTVFALEFVVLGRLHTDALVPALVAALVGDLVTRALGIVHTPYPAVQALALTPLVLGKWLIFAAAVAATSAAFIEAVHGCKRLGERWLPRLPVRMMCGGAAVVAAAQLLGTHDYLGLGIPMILRAFEDPGLPAYAFAAKLVLTAITLGAGFMGGEVTPLFFVGATLGNVLGRTLDLPLPLAAGVGLAALFGAASNTPLALSIMAVELLGAAVLPHVLIVSVFAYLLSGHRSIYSAQRLLAGKAGGELPTATRLRDLRPPGPPGDQPQPPGAVGTGS